MLMFMEDFCYMKMCASYVLFQRIAFMFPDPFDSVNIDQYVTILIDAQQSDQRNTTAATLET